MLLLGKIQIFQQNYLTFCLIFLEKPVFGDLVR